MIVRPVDPGDKQALREFACSDGTVHANRLELWVRKKSFGWAFANVEHRLRVLEDFSGLYAYEPGGLIYSLGDDPDDTDDLDQPNRWFVKIVAAALPHGRRIGGRLLETCLDEISEIDPGSYVHQFQHRRTHAPILRTGCDRPSPLGHLCLSAHTSPLHVPQEGRVICTDDEIQPSPALIAEARRLIAMRSAEQHEIEGAFLELLRGPTGDGQNKRSRGEKPLWKYDPSHYDALMRHLARYVAGERYDPDSGAPTLSHIGWRALALAYQQLDRDGFIPDSP